jgi:hypothetical protein
MDQDYAASFTAADHTRIVRAVLEHPLHVIKQLHIRPGQAPTAVEVLDAALQVRSFDADLKLLLTSARAACVQVTDALARADRPPDLEIAGFRAALEAGPVTEMISRLDALGREHDLDEASSRVIGQAREILIDGAGTIYAPTYPPNELLESADSPASGVAQADAMALAQAAPLIPDVPGVALGYAAGTSAATAVTAVLQSVFG